MDTILNELARLQAEARLAQGLAAEVNRLGRYILALEDRLAAHGEMCTWEAWAEWDRAARQQR